MTTADTITPVLPATPETASGAAVRVQRLVSRRSPQQRATLRTCASCEWVHRGHEGCPKCGFATYGARWVYGAACYKYERTQKPWMDKKLASYTSELLAEIESANSVISNHPKNPPC